MRSIYTVALLFLLPYVGISQEEILSKNPKILRGLSLKGSHYDPQIVRTEAGIVGGRPEIGQYQPPIPYPELQQKADGALMTPAVSAGPSPSPSTTFGGMGYTSVCPADPTMAVSSSYIVQMINAASGAKFQVWSKTSPYTIVASAALLGTRTGMQGLGDCISLYDQYHDRFILTELPANDNGLIVAVSQTNDPTGNYNSYFFPLSFSPDYPKYSVWNGVLYGKTNNFSGSSFTGSSVFAFDLAAMVNGTANPSVQEFDLNQGTYQNYSMCPVGMVGTNTISTPGGLFAYLADNSWTGSSVDKVGLLRLDPASHTLYQAIEIPVSAYNPSVRSISQPKGQSLDALADIVMNQPICRASSSTSASLAMAFTVNISSKQAGVRCEVLNYTSGTWSFAADGTYTGSDGQNRWLPSVNIDADGKIGLGFNISGSKVYPSIGNVVLTQSGTSLSASTEYRIANGTTSSNCSGRYGDYNHMVIDPSDGHTFWFTAMYNPVPSWSTKIGSFSASAPSPTIVQKGGIANQTMAALTKNATAYPNPVHNTLTLQLPGEQTKGTVEIINISGQMVNRQNVSARQVNINTAGLNNGVYILKLRTGKGVDYLKFLKQ